MAEDLDPFGDFEMGDLDNMAQNPDDDEEFDPNYGDQFVNTRFSDLYEPGPSGTHQVAETQPAPAKPPCKVRLFPTSQETPPPVPFTEPPRQ